MRLVFATHNKHKLAEIQQLVSDSVEIISLDDLGYFDDIEETGSTLSDNALLKARIVHGRVNISTFADDTGLEVEALDGAPGVFSARFAGDDNNAIKNMNKLLELLEGETNRNARFRTIIALIHNKKEYLFEGIVEGTILESPRGEKGFGYDPVFEPIGYDVSFAEMNPKEKNSISHRGRAVLKLVDYLNHITE